MASYSYLVLILCVVSGLNFSITRSQGISLSITPDKCIATTVNDVQISCVVNGSEDKDKEITLIEISRNNQEPIAFLKQCSNISYGSDSSSQFQADGSIEKNFNQSYLNLTLTNPKSEDTGIYTCVMYYVDETGVLRNEKSSQNFLVEKLDVKTLETVLNTLKDKINDVEKKSKGQSDKNTQDVMGKVTALDKRIKGLEDDDIMGKVTDLDKKIQSLKENVTSAIAFTAIDNRSTIPTKGEEVLIFPDVILNVGGGYNGKTGVFTAPRNGFYNFHVSLSSSKAAMWVEVKIKVNKEVLTHFGVGDQDYHVQSSVSSIAKLVIGDKVYPLVTSGGDNLYGNQQSAFSGYLIMPF